MASSAAAANPPSQLMSAAVGVLQMFFVMMVLAWQKRKQAQAVFWLVCSMEIVAAFAAHFLLCRVIARFRQVEDFLSAAGMVTAVAVAQILLCHHLIFEVKSGSKADLVLGVLEFVLALAGFVLCIAAPIRRDTRSAAAAAAAPS